MQSALEQTVLHRPIMRTRCETCTSVPNSSWFTNQTHNHISGHTTKKKQNASARVVTCPIRDRHTDHTHKSFQAKVCVHGRQIEGSCPHRAGSQARGRQNVAPQMRTIHTTAIQKTEERLWLLMLSCMQRPHFWRTAQRPILIIHTRFMRKNTKK